METEVRYQYLRPDQALCYQSLLLHILAQLETLEHAAGGILREVRHRLEQPGTYSGHGRSLCEGLWKDGGGA